jgi:ATP-binding cassette, subfamily B, bacterial
MRNAVYSWYSGLKPSLRSLGWTLQLLWRSHRAATVAVSVITLAQGVIPVGQLWVTKLLIDQVALVIGTPANQRTDQMIAAVFIYLALEAGIILGGILIGIVSGHAYNVLSEHLSLYVQVRILEQCARLDLAAYESPVYYNQLQQAQEQANQAPILVLRRLLELAQSAVTLFSISLIVFLYKPWIIIILAVATIPGFWVAIHYGRQRFFLYNHRTPAGRRAAYLGYVLSTDEYAKEVRVWGLTRYLMRSLQTLRTRFKQENIDLSRKQSIYSFIGEAVSTLGYYGSYAVVIFGAVSGELTIGDITLYGGAFSRSQILFESLLSAIANVYETQLFIQNLELFLKLEPQVLLPSNPVPIPSLSTGICVDDLTFSYPEVESKTLNNVNFTIRPNECVAIVGSNGSGKTTLVKLLLRLYDPSSGSIKIDGVDLRDLDPEQLRNMVAVVFQDYAHYQMTARENIGFGKIEAINDLEQIRRAAQEAGVESIINGLPDAYETVLGRQFEGGHELSLGQWQRIAVARALLRDAPILILDEPTAAMDAQAEYELYQQLRKLARGRMTILISHRFSTVRMADRIFVLEHGRLIEEGTHEELLARDSRYAYFFRLQAESYQTSPDALHAYHGDHDERVRTAGLR